MLEDAHRRLRDGVAAYERFTAADPKPGEPVDGHDSQVARAQADVEAAERELWRLREELLAWSRPPWAPVATLVADWFSAEDAVYDDITSGSGR